VDLVRGERSEQPSVMVSEVTPDPIGDLSSSLGQSELIEAAVAGVAIACDPAPSLQAGDQPAHRALLQAQPLYKLLLRQGVHLGELAQGHHLRQGPVLSRMVVRLEEAAEPDEALQYPTELIIRKCGSRRSCILQLLPLEWSNSCNVQLREPIVHETQHRDHHRANMYGVARHAVGYERHTRLVAGPLYRRVARDVGSAGLAAGAVTLDVGTGPGSVPRLVAAAHPELILEGVDLSPEMITVATNAAHAEGVPSIRFQVGDVAAMPYPDESVDLVISSLSMHHWEDPAAGLGDIVRVLRPGGRAWIYDFRPNLRRTVGLTAGLAAEASLESPLVGTFWFNPIGRLVLRRRVSPI